MLQSGPLIVHDQLQVGSLQQRRDELCNGDIAQRDGHGFVELGRLPLQSLVVPFNPAAQQIFQCQQPLTARNWATLLKHAQSLFQHRPWGRQLGRRSDRPRYCRQGGDWRLGVGIRHECRCWRGRRGNLHLVWFGGIVHHFRGRRRDRWRDIRGCSLYGTVSPGDLRFRRIRRRSPRRPGEDDYHEAEEDRHTPADQQWRGGCRQGFGLPTTGGRVAGRAVRGLCWHFGNADRGGPVFQRQQCEGRPTVGAGEHRPHKPPITEPQGSPANRARESGG